MKKNSSSKHSKLKGIPKLDDANDAGGENSRECTLIVTERDSAKTLAVCGLGVVGRDRYGVFPLRGKLLNVREATRKQVSKTDPCEPGDPNEGPILTRVRCRRYVSHCTVFALEVVKFKLSSHVRSKIVLKRDISHNYNYKGDCRTLWSLITD